MQKNADFEKLWSGMNDSFGVVGVDDFPKVPTPVLTATYYLLLTSYYLLLTTYYCYLLGR